MAQKKSTAPGTTPGALTHSPFARLAETARLAGLAKSPAPPEPHRPELRKPFAPRKLRMRLESTGRSGKVVTRVSGLPVENLEAIASRLRKALGCGASIEDGEVILQGSLKERAAEWLERAGDLDAIKDPDQRVSARTATASAPAPSASAPSSSLSGAKRRDVRPGQRVAVVQKADQQSGKLTDGIVRDLLTSSSTHPRGIKVRLESGEVGRVKIVY